MFDHGPEVGKAKKNVEEAQVMLELKFKPSKSIDDLFVEYENGYFKSNNGGEFIKGKVPVDKVAINGRKVFRRYDHLDVKYLIKAIPVGFGNFKIFTYVMTYDFIEMTFSWQVKHIVDFTVPSEKAYVFDINSNGFPLSISMEALIDDIGKEGTQVDLDLSAIIMSADPFCRDPFFDLFYNVLGLIDDDYKTNPDNKGLSKVEIMKNGFRNINCSGKEFAKKWGAVFHYIDFARTWAHTGIQKIIDSGYDRLLVDIFDGDCFSPKLSKIIEVHEGRPIVDAPKSVVNQLENCKWAHRMVTLETVERMSKCCSEYEAVDLIFQTNKMYEYHSDDFKNKALMNFCNTLIREKKSKRA